MIRGNYGFTSLSFGNCNWTILWFGVNWNHHIYRPRYGFSHVTCTCCMKHYMIRVSLFHFFSIVLFSWKRLYGGHWGLGSKLNNNKKSECQVRLHWSDAWPFSQFSLDNTNGPSTSGSAHTPSKDPKIVK